MGRIPYALTWAFTSTIASPRRFGIVPSLTPLTTWVSLPFSLFHQGICARLPGNLGPVRPVLRLELNPARAMVEPGAHGRLRDLVRLDPRLVRKPHRARRCLGARAER